MTNLNNPLLQSSIRGFSTGLINAPDGNDILTINSGDSTKFDIKRIRYQFVDNSDPSNPTIQEIIRDTQTAITVTNIATQPATYILLDSNGDITQTFPFPNKEILRDKLFIGVLEHANLSTITRATNAPGFFINQGLNWYDLAFSNGTINLPENKVTISANGANMKFDMSSGNAFFPSINFSNDLKNPNISTENALTPVTFVYLYNDGTGGIAVHSVTDTINPDLYDNGSGTLQTTPDNKFTIQRVLVGVGNGTRVIKFGTNTYNSLKAAYNSVKIEPNVFLSGEEAILLVGYIIVQQGATDLSDTTQALFVQGSKFGDLRENSNALPASLTDAALVNWSFTSRGVGAGTYYADGSFYNWNTVDANLTQASISVTWGTANSAYGAHASIVAGGAGIVDAGVIGLKVTGTSITDSGVRVAGDSETILSDITAAVLNKHYETTKKWIGQVTYELFIVSGSPTTYSFNLNYGLDKYEDFINRDIFISGFQAKWLGGATDSNADIILRHHDSDALWTYAATGFTPGGTILAQMSVDYGTESNIVNNEDGSYKRDNLNTFVKGSGMDGVVVEIVTGQNNTFQSMDGYILGEL